MLESLAAGRPIELNKKVLPALVVGAVLLLAFFLGARARLLWAAAPIALAVGLLLLRRPALGLPLLVFAALLLPLEIRTGTEVALNPVALLVPALLGIWGLGMLLRREPRLAASPANRPLLLFLLAGLLSLIIGRATWDPNVPVKGTFIIVQLAQWALFAFSAGAFWLTANLIKDERRLRRLTAAFLLLAGGVAILRMLPGLGGLTSVFATIAFIRAPLWMLLAALAAGQLIFNNKLSALWRLFLAAILLSVFVYAFVLQGERISNWIGVGSAIATLIWLRFPRLRWPVVALVVALLAFGSTFPFLYEFAGGDEKWIESGGSRLVLIERVVELTMRNPITGLGPAAYRQYGFVTSLRYMGAFYVSIALSSHNNYVDLFSHVGLLGLSLFFWFVIELARLGARLRRRYTHGFAAGYVNAALAAGMASLLLMFFADWILPFVYNIGFPGFQASVLVWLFLGGLVALDNLPPAETAQTA
jgi:hypothetical protein